MKPIARLRLLAFALLVVLPANAAEVKLSEADYRERCEAIWTAQIASVLLGLQFEHKPAAARPVDAYPKRYTAAPVDDDWYYEMVTLDALEKHGLSLTVRQLGEEWRVRGVGTWGASRIARERLEQGVNAPDTGHPRYNMLWFSIAPMLTAEIFGMLAPAQPNRAAALARELTAVHGYAEAVDAAAFVAGAVSLGFAENSTSEIVRAAARLVPAESPLREALDDLMRRADAGEAPDAIADAIENRWRVEYPASNNAVSNAALTALGLWFGEGDFLRTANLIFAVADYTDTDCNAASATAVLAAIHGLKLLPGALVGPLGGRIRGRDMLGVRAVTPPVDETLAHLAGRTVAMGGRFLSEAGAKRVEGGWMISREAPFAPPVQRFRIGDLMTWFAPGWSLERASPGGELTGIKGSRGITHLEDDVLVTFPRDDARGLVIRRTVRLEAKPRLRVEVSADPGRTWELEIYADNKLLVKRQVSSGTQRDWQAVEVDLAEFANRETVLRLFQKNRVEMRLSGNACWRNLTLVP